VKFIGTLLLLLLFSLNLKAENNQARSIHWQQVQLEEKLQNTITQFLGLYLSKDKFYVHLKVETKEQNLAVPDSGIKFKGAGDKFIKGNVPSSMNADLVALDKIGVFAPKFDAKNDKELEVKLFKYKNKLERDFLKKTDLFSFLEKVTVFVAVDESISNKQYSGLKKLVQKILPNFGKVDSVIEPYRVAFAKEVVAPKTFFDKLSDWNVLSGLGLVLASLIASLTAFVLFGKYKSLKELILASESSHDSSDDTPLPSLESTDVVDAKTRPGSDQLAEMISNSENGIDRYVIYLTKSPIQAINLVKKWINLGTDMCKIAIFSLSEKLTVDELTLVFSELSLKERENFGSVSSLHFSSSEKAKAESYIGQQVLEDILDLSFNVDKDLQKLLVELTPQQGIEISTKDKELGAILLNIMNVDFVAEMMKLIPKDTFEGILSAGLKVEQDKISEKLSLLRAQIESLGTKSEENTFARRAIEVLSGLTSEKETAFLNVLVGESKFAVVKEFCSRVIPAHLIFDVDEDILRKALSKIDLHMKVSFLLGKQESERLDILNKITREGTKGRDLIEHELEEGSKDNKKLVKAQHDAPMLNEFIIETIRSFVDGQDNALVIKKETSSEWLSQVIGDELPSDEFKPSLVDVA